MFFGFDIYNRSKVKMWTHRASRPLVSSFLTVIERYLYQLVFFFFFFVMFYMMPGVKLMIHLQNLKLLSEMTHLMTGGHQQ